MEKMSDPIITAAILYDLVHCPHRIYLDQYGDETRRDPESAFLRLLWERGALHEREVMSGTEAEYTDLSALDGEDRERATLEAMDRGDPLIYSGRIRAGDLLGIPDLLRKEAGGYTAGDIKSGAALQGGNDLEDGRPRKHYAVQLALYTDILRRLGRAGDGHPFIWDVNGRETSYDLDVFKNSRSGLTWRDFYRQNLESAREILSRRRETHPAYTSVCRQCHWYSFCKNAVHQSRDLTLIPFLGRSKRDTLQSQIRNLHQMARCRVVDYVRGPKTVFPRIGPDSLKKFRLRAQMLLDPHARPFALMPIHLPDTARELFYDVETDPLQDICYLHGFMERTNRDPASERYVPFYADEPTPDAEKAVFQQAWKYIRDSRPCAVYYYSSYEKTTLRRLQKRYPDVASEQEIEVFFESASTVDLYTDIIIKKTEWPANDRSIKSLAPVLGFKWRDENPSGAESIEWYDEWVRTGNPDAKKRILLYNEDDCVATRVVLDGVRQLEVRSQ